MFDFHHSWPSFSRVIFVKIRFPDFSFLSFQISEVGCEILYEEYWFHPVCQSVHSSISDLLTKAFTFPTC